MTDATLYSPTIPVLPPSPPRRGGARWAVTEDSRAEDEPGRLRGLAKSFAACGSTAAAAAIWRDLGPDDRGLGGSTT